MSQVATTSQNKESGLSLMKSGGLKEIWNVGSAFAQSQIVPKNYQGNIPNCVVAIEMANNMRVSPLTVMQNLDIIQGKPSWSSQYVISQVNSSGRFSPIQWKINRTEVSLKGTKYVESGWEGGKRKNVDKVFQQDIKDIEFIAYATDLKSGDTLESPMVSLRMAILEGWYTKNGSKWQTMPDLMGRYRSAAFFGRLYCPDVIHGFQTKEEIVDAEYTVVDTPEEKSNATVNTNANETPIDFDTEPDKVTDEVEQSLEGEGHNTTTGEVNTPQDEVDF